MAEGGKSTELSPGLIARASGAYRAGGVSGLIRGVSTAWMGPMQPLGAMAPTAVGRQYDYGVGFNLDTRPRASSSITFQQLIDLSKNCDVLRTVIETRKDQMVALGWRVKPKKEKSGFKPENDKRIQEIEDFLASPDKVGTWQQWLRQLLEDHFVIDAVTIWRRPTRGGKLYSLDLIDGATISVKIDESGRLPAPPDPAYQQILKGVPAVDYSRDELIYFPRNLTTRTVYGYSHVEQIIITVNIAIRRALHQLNYYKEGNLPDALIGTPKDWTPAQVKEFQKFWDSQFAGNLSKRRRGTFIPGDAKNFQAIMEPPLKDMYDEWLARIICFCFKVSNQPFVQQNNRATAETQHATSQDEGLISTRQYIKSLMDKIIREDFAAGDLEFAWVDAKENDALEESEILDRYTAGGMMKLNEGRAAIGLEPDPGPNANRLCVRTANGMVPVDETPEEKAIRMAGAGLNPDGSPVDKAPEEGDTGGAGGNDKAEKADFAALKKKPRPLPA